MWIHYNPNPAKKNVPDCVIRALCKALKLPWLVIFDDLTRLAREMYSVQNADAVWGEYLKQNGFVQFLLRHDCPQCITVKQFCKLYPDGVYVIGTGDHAVCVINGNYYDSGDSGDMVATFFWRQT